MTTATRPTETGPRLEEIRLESGCHDERAEGVCLMELAAWMAGEEHSAFPSCVLPTLRDYASFANDHLDDGPRQMLREIARELSESGCACEQDIFDVLIREALRHGVCTGLRRNGMIIQAQELEAALEPAREGPLAQGARERVVRVSGMIERAARGLSQDEGLLEMTRQAHTAAASAWGKGPPGLHAACWAAHRAVMRAIPDQDERAGEIIRQVRTALGACRCGRRG